MKSTSSASFLFEQSSQLDLIVIFNNYAVIPFLSLLKPDWLQLYSFFI